MDNQEEVLQQQDEDHRRQKRKKEKQELKSKHRKEKRRKKEKKGGKRSGEHGPGGRRDLESTGRESSPLPLSPPSPITRLADLYLKIAKYALARHKGRKLDKLLRHLSPNELSCLLGMRDSKGHTPLHQACYVGNTEAMSVLLKYGAQTELQDHNGDTPGHVAAARGHLVALTQILQAKKPPDVNIQNFSGRSLQQMVSDALAASGPPAGEKIVGTASWNEEAEKVDEDEEWRKKLRSHDSDAEDGWGGDSWHGGHHGADAVGGETYDDWADRMWAEMSGRRRREAEAASRLFSRNLRSEAQAKAAAEAARQASERILHEERAKDEAWRRQAALPSSSSSSQPSPLDPGQQHIAYEAKWRLLDARHSNTPAQATEAKAIIGWDDIPWPLPDLYLHDMDIVRDVLLYGVKGPTDIRQRLRKEIMRWHPDKFSSRFRSYLDPKDAQRILHKVQEISQIVTGIMGKPPGQ